MNYVRQPDKTVSAFAAFVTAMVVLTLTVAAVPAHGQTYTVLDDFLVGGPGPQWPGGPLAQGRDGNLYGYSYLGGANNTGSIWKTDASGVVSVVYSFATGTGNDCQNGMTLGTDGNFYGTALTNCAGAGYVFKLTPSGTLTVLHTFTGTPDGYSPGLLIQYTDGNFYGITQKGGTNNYGTVFKITPAGTLTTLYSFPQTDPYPSYGLTAGNDGNFYGTTAFPGLPGGVFKATPAGVVTVLHAFTGDPDGYEPFAGVILGKDGNFYGTTQFGGANNVGCIFKMTPSGTITLLYSFTTTDYANYPSVPLLQATDGNFYSTANSCNQFGGCLNQDIYKITPSGTLTVLEEFIGSNGQWPYWPLMQDTNGTLYGLSQQGGTVNGGVLFSLNIGAQSFINLEQTSGKVGSKVSILGQGFSSSSVVKLGGGVVAAHTLTGTTYISATVPAGATDGKVTVTTGSTTLTSRQTYTVHDSWSSGAAMPTARMGAFTGTVGTSIYVIGGIIEGGALVGVNEIYNTKTNKWTTGTPDPTTRWAGASAVVGGIVYLFGGSDGDIINLVEAYNPATDTWSTKSPMPSSRQGAAAVVDGNIVYVIGGQNSSIWLATVESYNTTTDTWTTEASLLAARSFPAAGLLGTTPVAADGGNSTSYTGDNESYNTTLNTWTTLTADPTPRGQGCFSAISGQLYVAGGTGNTGQLSLNEAYSSTKKSWTTLTPMPNGVSFAGSAQAGGLLYCFGGGIYSSGTAYNYLQIYQP